MLKYQALLDPLHRYMSVLIFPSKTAKQNRVCFIRHARHTRSQPRAAIGRQELQHRQADTT